MKALVIYDARCRYAAQVSEVVTYALQTTMRARRLTHHEVTLSDLEDVNLVVIGFRTRPHDTHLSGDEFLETVPDAMLRDKAFAIFDTCLDGWKSLTRSAAEGLARKLVKREVAIILPPESFTVSSFTEPLSEREHHRAENWARAIQQQLQLLPF